MKHIKKHYIDTQTKHNTRKTHIKQERTRTTKITNSYTKNQKIQQTPNINTTQ